MLRWTTRLGVLYAVFSGAAPAQEDVLIPTERPIELNVQRLNERRRPHDLLLTFLSEVSDETPHSEYWLGVQVAALPEIAKKQLSVEDGLAVEEVTPDSPAAKAHIQKFDVLIKAGDTPLKSTADLVKAIDASQGKEIEIVIIHDAIRRTIKATAEKRPKSEVLETVRRTVTAARPELAGEIKQLEEALEKLKSRAGADGIVFGIAKPAVVAPHFDLKYDMKLPARVSEGLWKNWKSEFPKDLSVQINKQGDQPAKIHVKRGDKEEWDVTEDKLGDLPDDVRPHVERMMGNMLVPAFKAEASKVLRIGPEGKLTGEGTVTITPPAPPAPAAPKAAAAPKAPVPPRAPAAPQAARSLTFRTDRAEAESDAKLDAILKKLDERSGAIDSLNKKVEELKKELDELRTKK